jgi:hypothetical protein
MPSKLNQHAEMTSGEEKRKLSREQRMLTGGT